MAVTPTFYIALDREEEFLAHFEDCRNATDMEMVVYNIPSCVGSSIPVSVIEAAAENGWSSCCKESSGDRDFFEQSIAIAIGSRVFSAACRRSG
jgi:dihydrodipicolinate synthase/N-acetylneuraminate lyase